MRDLFSQLLAVGPELAAFVLTASMLSSQSGVYAAPASVPSPNLDLSQLGRVALGGDFDSISLYTYQGQSEASFSTNGSQALLTQLPNGAFQNLDSSDAHILAMCPFVLADGTLAGVVVGGNFTSLGGAPAQAVALFDPKTTTVTPLPGLNGTVNALYCDQPSSTVYVGGNFQAPNATNAMSWTTGWVNLPFAGFNGPVTSIAKNSAGNIVFGGDFTGLGNTSTPQEPDGQVVNLGSGTIAASGSTAEPGFSNPSQIICKTGSEDPTGNVWLLNDNTQGWWQGSYAFGFNPTKLRLYNTNYQGRGTKSFYFENLNSGGILNLTYTDANGKSQSCINFCPLQATTGPQDFHFSPSVGMNMFRIWITDFYGPGGGLAGIEMFQDLIYSYAVDSFNEPKCDGVSNLGSISTGTPNSTWTRIPNKNETVSDYLSAALTSPAQVGPSTEIVFGPDLKQPGNYSIMLYTPGCLMDNSCNSRGQVNVTGSLTSGVASSFSINISQTNNYEKFDQIYFGYVDSTSDSFRPTVTLAPLSGQTVPLTVVAQRVRFDLVDSTGGLNGLYEYNRSQSTVNTDFSISAINRAGSELGPGASINALAVSNGILYAVGNFSGPNGISNALSIGNGNATALTGGGLNDNVMALYQDNTLLYMGGNFTSTADGKTQNLNNAAVFSTSDNTWSALGAGVNGPVVDIVPLTLNVTNNNVQNCISLTGTFTSVNAFAGSQAFNASGIAIWVPKLNNWLNNIPNSTISITGDLNAFTNVPGYSTLYGGAISSQSVGLVDAVELVGSGQPAIQSLGIKLQQLNSSAIAKRALTTASTGQNYSGVYDGLFYSDNNLNVTVLGGSFATTATNGTMVENLVFLNNTAAQTVGGVSGLDSSSVFVAMDTHNTRLWAGGAVKGNVNGNAVNGLIVYDLVANSYASPLPPALAGENVVVNSIATQPGGSNVYVGGNFQSAGSLPCPALCYYDTSALQWNSPGSGLSGTINFMLWSSSTTLVIAGNLSISGNATTMATYDTKTSVFQEYAGASTLPGPIVAMSAADNSYDQYWAAGVATNNGSTFLYKYDDGTWTAASGLGAGTVIRGLQVMGVTSNHANSDLMPNDQILMITGNINVPNFGNASAVVFNGTAYEPFVLTNRQDGSVGSIAQIFVSNPQNFMNSSNHHLALGLVVLIGLAIALGLIFLIVVAGILIERQRRRREGYVPMTTDKSPNISRLPPETLLANLKEKGSPPRI